MLRPSKLFVSLHQLRLCCQMRISELVSSQLSKTSYTAIQSKNINTTQQMITLFSAIQQVILKKTYSSPPPTIKGPLTNDRFLIHIIQHHLPLKRTFSQSAAHRRAWNNTLPSRYQFRTMMSGTSNSNGPATTLLAWGFPRSTTAGFGRNSPAFSRHFSTTKSPCVTLFQNNASNGQNVFSHVSSRIFSPAGTKMYQPEINEQTSMLPTVSYNASNGDNENSPVCYNRLVAIHRQHNKGMGELIPSADESKDMENNRLFIRRGSQQQQKRKYTMKLDAIIREDDLYDQNRPGSKKRIYANHTQLKEPPDPYHVEKKDDPLMMERPKSASIYMLIMLDTLQFWNNREEEDYLGPSFIDSIQQMAYDYQLHISGVLKLLENLQRHGQFRVISRQGQLRVYFPSTIQSEQEAVELLYAAEILDPAHEQPAFFTVATEDILVSPVQNDPVEEDYFSYKSNATVGPDYFKDLQLFLDHADYLIETSPAFRKHRI